MTDDRKDSIRATIEMLDQDIAELQAARSALLKLLGEPASPAASALEPVAVEPAAEEPPGKVEPPAARRQARRPKKGEDSTAMKLAKDIAKRGPGTVMELSKRTGIGYQTVYSAVKGNGEWFRNGNGQWELSAAGRSVSQGH